MVPVERSRSLTQRLTSSDARSPCRSASRIIAYLRAPWRLFLEERRREATSSRVRESRSSGSWGMLKTSRDRPPLQVRAREPHINVRHVAKRPIARGTMSLFLETDFQEWQLATKRPKCCECP